jgi:Spy/CpxP family protein refolding chaperone
LPVIFEEEFEYRRMLNMNHPGLNRLEPAWRIVPAIAAALVVACLALVAHSARAADDPNKTVAVVGDHKISQKDLDAKIKPKMEALERKVAQVKLEIERQALESMTDEYLIGQAAQHDKLSVDDYLKKEYTGKSAVTDVDAKKFYDQN